MRPARRLARTSCVTSCVGVLRGRLVQTCFFMGIGSPKDPCADALRGRLAQGLAQPCFHNFWIHLAQVLRSSCVTIFGFTISSVGYSSKIEVITIIVVGGLKETGQPAR